MCHPERSRGIWRRGWRAAGAPASYTASTTELQPGDRIVAYTDGITEALDARGEAFGEQRLHALLRERRDVIESV